MRNSEFARTARLASAAHGLEPRPFGVGGGAKWGRARGQDGNLARVAARAIQAAAGDSSVVAAGSPVARAHSLGVRCALVQKTGGLSKGGGPREKFAPGACRIVSGGGNAGAASGARYGRD